MCSQLIAGARGRANRSARRAAMMGQLHEAFLTSAREVGLLDEMLQLIEGEKASIRPRSTTRAGAHIRRHPFPSKDSFI